MRRFVPFRDAPIRRKLMLIGLLTTALALFSVSLILVARDWVDWREKTLSEMGDYAALIGANAAPSMIFGDYDAATEVLRTLGENSDIVDAVLYDKEGKEFARYRAPMHPDSDFPFVKPDSYLFTFDQLVVSKPVTLKGEVWGSVYLESDLRSLYADIKRQTLLTFIAAAGVFMVTLFLFFRLQRAIVDPITNLSGVMRQVSAKQDYAVRVPVLGKDEVGVLAGTFNDMLTQIQARDEVLARHSEQLEQEVAQRTVKLTEAQRIAHLGNWEWDIASNTMSWSEEIYRIFALSPQQLGSSLEAYLQVVHPEDRQFVEQRVREAIEQRSAYSMDHRILRPDGAVRYVHEEAEVVRDKDGRPVRVVGTVQDITDSKLAEAALRKANIELGLFRTLIDNSSDGIEVLDPATMRFLDISEKECHDLGYSREEMMSMTVFDIDPAVDKASTDKTKEQLRETGSARFETIHRRKDGSLFPVEVSIRLVELDRPYLMSMVRDITERKQAEDALRKVNVELSLFRTLIDNSSDGIYVVDPATMRFLDVNEQACRELGYGREELLGMSVFDIDPVFTEEVGIQTVKQLQASGSISFESLHRRKDGSTHPVEISSGYIELDKPYILSTVRDISERRRAEAERRRLSEAVAQSTEAIVLTDTGRSITYVNPSFTRLFGYSAQEVVGQSLDLLAVEDSTYPAPHQTIEIALAQGAYSGETMRRAKDGRAILVLLNVATVRDEQNRISGYVGTMTDLTELKRVELEARQRMVELTHANAELRELNARLVQAQSQLMQSEKMASIGMLAAGVAHEINNPVGYIRSNLGTLGNYIGNFIEVLDAYEKVERSMPDRSELFAGTEELKGRLDLAYIKQDVVALLSESHEGVERVTKIVQDLKDFSRIETEEKWIPENIHHGIDSTLNVIWNELKYKCEVVKEYGELPNIDCLPSQLNQVFMNLLVNAAQAIEVRGRITIRTGREEDRVWVEVSDTGQGIPPENISRLFDPFFTTKPVGKGTGLGLSVSYNIVEKHHGKIEVKSEVGKGSTFRVWLPISQQATKENA